MDPRYMNPYLNVLQRRAQDAVFSRAKRLPGIIVDAAVLEFERRLFALGGDIEAQLAYLADIPEFARRAATEKFFSAFFTHYLPRKFIHHYIYGGSKPLVLTEREMIDCNPFVAVLRSASFVTELTSFQPGTPVRKPLQLACLAAALTNGTLGQFTVKMNGVLDIRAADHWMYVGKMTFHDTWDFDPKNFGTGGRSLQGELKTRFAQHLLPGNPFKVESEEVDFSQSSKDATVLWKGGTPKIELDRIAAGDVALQKKE